jgi:hypothetical protein
MMVDGKRHEEDQNGYRIGEIGRRYQQEVMVI